MNQLLAYGFIGAALGWLLHFIMDRLWWSDRRICTEEEIRLRDRVGTLESDKKLLEGRVSEFDAERTEWDTRFVNQDREIANYKARISDHESETMNLTKRIGEHEKEVGTLKGQITERDGKLGAANKRISGLTADLDAAKKAPKVAAAAVGGTAVAAAGAAAMAAKPAKAAPAPAKPAAPKPAPAAAPAATEKDDLQKLWGVGPASEKVLNDNGIYTYAQLCKQDPDNLKKMLDESGGTFNLVREDTWPEQACMAEAERWPELDTMQEELSADYVNQTVTEEFTGTPDELTKLWGIGPAVEKVLHSKGVYKFDQLAGMPLKMLQGIITAAGPRFTLVKPELWIPQAKVAATGDWDALDTLKAKISAENKR